jgi:hypothetical protein
MNFRIMRLTIAVIMLVSSIVPHTYASLKDYNPAGYVDDLSSLPGLEIYQHKPAQYSVSSIVKWIDANQMLCAAGLTAAGFVLLYVVSADVRNKVHAWLGLRAEQSDEVES